MQHRSEPLLSMHPDDAAQLGVKMGDIVRVRSRLASNLLRIELDAGLQRGNLFAPMHWTSVYASSARVDALIPAHTDPLSGQPESKHAVVAVEKFHAIWQGWYLTRDDWQPTTAYWVKVPLADVTLWKLADDTPCKLEPFLLGEGDVLRYTDTALGIVRVASLNDDLLQSVLFVAPQTDERLPSADWVASLFAQGSLTDSQRFALLSGQDSTSEDVGAMVCACFQVGQKTIEATIKSGATTVDAVGACCQAGTNCGSCIPEIKALLAKTLSSYF
jgi:assimilatory nitrate reductase catalytic subunit